MMKAEKYSWCLMVITCIFFSCKREKVSEVYPEMRGSWIHHTTNKEYHYLSIGNDSRGSISYYKNHQFDHDTQERKWFIKKNSLVFGRITGKEERFHIDSLPQTSNRFFIVDDDTVKPQDRYMFLNGGLYVDGN